MSGQSAGTPPLHVLLVEDEASQRENMRALLEGMGCRVDVAADGGEAVRRALELRPDVVLMDLGLPVVEGWTAIRVIRERVRQHAVDHSPYIIALSSFVDAESRRRAFDAGCDEYVTKSTDVGGSLRAYVQRWPHRSLRAR